MLGKPAVWIDFENAPHVWVMSQIMKSLEQNDHPLILTGRPFSYTLELCRQLGFDVQPVGVVASQKSTVAKALRLLHRASLLYLQILPQHKRIGVALSHGSRSQALAAHCLGIPVVSLDDYEFSNQAFVRFVDHMLVPFPIPHECWGLYAHKVTSYPGLKEHLYLYNYTPKPQVIGELRDIDRVQVLLRLEAHFAHYRSQQTGVIQRAILEHLANLTDVFLTILPRDATQAKQARQLCEKFMIEHWIPDQVLKGPDLIWGMDIMIGGGGTMTREAAVLGVPSYSFFGGKWGAVDRYLVAKRQMVHISSVEDVGGIVIRKRDQLPLSVPNDAQSFIVNFVHNLIG